MVNVDRFVFKSSATQSVSGVLYGFALTPRSIYFRKGKQGSLGDISKMLAVTGNTRQAKWTSSFYLTLAKCWSQYPTWKMHDLNFRRKGISVYKLATS